jgi:hypothetical protein
MQCTEARSKLNTATSEQQYGVELREHIASCQLCHRYAEDQQLTRTLQSWQVPGPDQAFLQQAMLRATQPIRSSANRKWSWLAATVASLALVGILMSWMNSSQLNGPLPHLRMADAPVQSVQQRVSIMIYSTDEQDAELSIALAENLELEGFAGQQTLTWNAHLTKGENLLSLPLLVNGAGGELQVTSRFAGRQHQVQLKVEAPRIIPLDSGITKPNRRENRV